MEDQLISSPVQSKEMANARHEFCFWAASALTAEKAARLEEAEDPRQHIHGRTTSWEGCQENKQEVTRTQRCSIFSNSFWAASLLAGHGHQQVKEQVKEQGFPRN